MELDNRTLSTIIDQRRAEINATVRDGKIKQSDQWILNYLDLPYLRDCPKSEVIERFNDVQANLCTITGAGQIGMGPRGDQDHFWLQRLTHVLEEFGLRGGIPGGLPRAPHFPTATYPMAPKGARIIADRPFRNDLHLIKLARREHADLMFRKGRFLICPASSYSSATHVAAIQDDEVSFWISVAEGERLNHRIGEREPERLDGQPTSKRQVVRLKYKDYFAFCMSASYDFRLLDDFGYDSFVVIYDIKRFAERLASAVRSIHPNSQFATRKVLYLDPYYCASWQLVPGFSKNIRYAYQHEWRFVWRMPDNVPLAKFFVELGSLEDIAELYLL